MPRTPERFYQGQPATSETTLATVETATDWVITDIVLCNTTGTAENISLSVVPDGNTADAANRILDGYEVSANDTVKLTGGGTVLHSGDFLSALQSTSGAITVTISGWKEN